MSNLLTRRQLAALLQVSVRTLDTLLKQGLPCIKVGKSVRFDYDEVLSYLKLQK